ncbi:MAG: hypothetical protein PHS67_07185 [Sphaerochaetaceae bacterium]|nr:hypothetical protein [Sphaerochaetaceae bacterium]
MQKKTLVVILILTIMLSSVAFAASTGSIGLVNYAGLADLQEGNSDAYVPGLRGEFFLSDFLGISADALLLDSWPDSDVYLMMYMINGVLRDPLGLVEPYVALGPAYLGVISDGETSLADDSFGFNVRGGVDFNILDWLSVGAEANFFVDDLENFFNNIGDYFTEEALNSSLIGITAKFKF